MTKTHDYTARVVWTGNRGTGTSSYRGYDRTWDIATAGKPVVHCSNDPLLGGNPALPNPEDLLLASLAACHMLWYLHLASAASIVVEAYEDDPLGIGESGSGGEGQFLRAVLRPRIVLAPGSDPAAADRIHHDIHRVCFIARSVRFPVTYEATYEVRQG